MLTVHQHWDPLKVCALGQTYPPEFYDRITNTTIRDYMKRIATETQEDLENVKDVLEGFGVEVIRTDLSNNPDDYTTNENGVLDTPPMCPRNYTAMVGDTFYMPGDNKGVSYDVESVMQNIFADIYNGVSDDKTLAIAKLVEDGLDPENKVSPAESLTRLKAKLFINDTGPNKRGKRGTKSYKYYYESGEPLPLSVRTDVDAINAGLPDDGKREVHRLNFYFDFKSVIDNFITAGHTFPNSNKFYNFTTIKNYLESKNVPIKYDTFVNASAMTRLGKDLIFSSMNLVNPHNESSLGQKWVDLFPDYNVHQASVRGFTDGAYTTIVPGLAIALAGMEYAIPNSYEGLLPDWEIVIPQDTKDSWGAWDSLRRRNHVGEPGMFDWYKMKKRMRGDWWLNNPENDAAIIAMLERWFDFGVQYYEQNILDWQFLSIDENNILCNGTDSAVFRAFGRYNVKPHVVRFRHRAFWDGGLHSITSDLSREGNQNSYFS
jgi:hypothetical protein|tara:strand:+ start:3403 stop:4869 length:1467 start_codon:yes stop_codon:yes gene_type:complete